MVYEDMEQEWEYREASRDGLPKFSPAEQIPRKACPQSMEDGEEWQQFIGSLKVVPWIRIPNVLVVVLWFSTAFAAATEAIQDMHMAFEEDIPVEILTHKVQI